MKRHALIALSLSLFSTIPAHAQNELQPDGALRAWRESRSPIEFSADDTWEALKHKLPTRLYDEIILTATEFLEGGKPGSDDARIRFIRGQAEEAVGLYEEAETDFQKCREAMGAPADEHLAQIGRIKAALPPLSTEVKEQGKAIFRVHYDSDSPLTKDIIETLPTAYEKNNRVMLMPWQFQPVFIFDTEARAKEFRAVQSQNKTASPAQPNQEAGDPWAAGSVSGLVFYLKKANGVDLSNRLLQNPDYIHSNIGHALNHCQLSRGLGDIKLPVWFEEGLASMIGQDVVKTSSLPNRRAIKRLLAGQALINPLELEDDKLFYDDSDAILLREETELVPPRPYDQSENMVRFLIGNMSSRRQFGDLLTKIRLTRSFDDGFGLTVGLTLPQFYALWARSLVS